MRCSHASARAFILEPPRSRRLVLWLLASHATALAGILALPVDALTQLAGLGALAAHAVWRRPRPIGRLIAAADGSWSLPDRGATALRVSGSSRLGRSWLELRLEGAQGRHVLLLCNDQLGPSAWRQLQARLRLEPTADHLS